MTEHIITRQERELAAADWLLSAAPDPALARADWADQGVALLACGTVLTAVRIPSLIVHTAAATNDPPDVAAFLADALNAGPVFFYPGGRHYYALTQPGTARYWRDAEAPCLASATYLGVPATDRTEPNPYHDAYWVVPIQDPGTLCAAGDIERLVAAGRAAVAGQWEDGQRA